MSTEKIQASFFYKKFRIDHRSINIKTTKQNTKVESLALHTAKSAINQSLNIMLIYVKQEVSRLTPRGQQINPHISAASVRIRQK